MITVQSPPIQHNTPRFGAVTATAAPDYGKPGEDPRVVYQIHFDTLADRTGFTEILDKVIFARYHPAKKQVLTTCEKPLTLTLRTGTRDGKPYYLVSDVHEKAQSIRFEEGHLLTQFKTWVDTLPLEPKYRDFLKMVAHTRSTSNPKDESYCPPGVEQVLQELQLGNLNMELAAKKSQVTDLAGKLAIAQSEQTRLEQEIAALTQK